MKNLVSAYRFCEDFTKSHYENFPVASMLFPKNKRSSVYPVYAFARTADDIADSDVLTSDLKIAELSNMRDLLRKSINGESIDSKESNELIYTALIDVINKLKIPAVLFEKLLDAFMQDSVKQKYKSFKELLEYSDNSANPVGRIVLYISGFNEKDNPTMFEKSDFICTALQLINFWQDVSRDLIIKRVYIPEEYMLKYGYTYEMLFEKKENDSFVKIIKELVLKTDELFQKGESLKNDLSGRLRLEFKATYSGGKTISKKIKNIDYKVLSERVKITKFDKLLILLKSV